MKNSQKVTTYGIFIALIVVLQLLSYAIKIGTFNLSLVLIPIVLGAFLYGVGAGALFGCAFGVIVYLCCVVNLDVGGHILFQANPWLTAAICILKGTAAGACAGAVARLMSKANGHLTIMLAAIVAPVVNTGLFVVGLYVFFKDILIAWAGGTDVFVYVFFTLIGVNFIIELLINVVMAPSLLTVKKALKK